MPSYQILVGSYSKEISTLVFDSDAGTLKVTSTVSSGQSPSWIAQHPTAKSLIFATNEVSEGKVQLFKLAEDGALEFVQEVSSGGRDPAALAVTESELTVANVGEIIDFIVYLAHRACCEFYPVLWLVYPHNPIIDIPTILPRTETHSRI